MLLDWTLTLFLYAHVLAKYDICVKREKDLKSSDSAKSQIIILMHCTERFMVSLSMNVGIPQKRKA